MLDLPRVECPLRALSFFDLPPCLPELCTSPPCRPHMAATMFSSGFVSVIVEIVGLYGSCRDLQVGGRDWPPHGSMRLSPFNAVRTDRHWSQGARAKCSWGCFCSASVICARHLSSVRLHLSHA